MESERMINMNNSEIGALIRTLRTEKGLTQSALAELLTVSDRTVSKWETGRGCPDISLLGSLSDILGVNIEEILSGGLQTNTFVSGNMKKSSYYVCPACGNLVISTGNATVSCCGRKLLPLQAGKPDHCHEITAEVIENDWFISSKHEMEKDHYISFVAFASSGEIKIFKTYPEWELQVRFQKRGHGILLWHCTKHGLFYKNI